MLRRILTTALAAGILAGVVISAVQVFTTTPLILHAEEYENAAAAAPPTGFVPASFVLVHGDAAGDGHHGPAPATWAPEDGAERVIYTALSNIIAGVGFALILTASFVLAGRRVDGRTGVLWGAAGFAVFTLAPSIGLPPELPGTAGGDLVARQTWWFLTVACTCGSLWLFVFRPAAWAKAAAVTLLLVPHAIGAPHPGELTRSVPPELAAQFAAVSIGVSAVFWTMLGWIAGTVFERLGRSAADPVHQPA